MAIIFIVDAFTNTPFSGNPAAVCVLTEPWPETWMQDVAREMNLSETAFLAPEGKLFTLRWFTPKVEVDLCGHATLASAHVLWEEGVFNPDEKARFKTKSGILEAQRKGDWIELLFPSEPENPVPTPAGLKEALKVPIKYTGRNRMDYLVEVESEKILRELKPDLSLIEKMDARGIIVTSLPATKDFDFVSRFFAPRVGIPEDPVTGSSHCCLGPYWKKRLNKDELTAYQASSRGGIIRVRVINGSVVIGGQAITIMRGKI